MRELLLTKGKIALVDDEDFYWLAQWNWQAVEIKGIWYAVRQVKKSPLRNPVSFQRFLHRVVMRVDDPEIFVDHKDHNGLNNQKSNLRLCSKTQNDWYSRKSKRKESSSTYIGVSWKADKKKWAAQIFKNGQSYFLGYFLEETDAAKAYDSKAKELFGEFANPNFK